MSARALRMLFLVTALLLPAQFVFATWVVRPHPALLFPFFDGVPGADGALALERRSVQAVYRGGETRELPIEALLTDLPDYTQTKTATRVFPRRDFASGAFDAPRAEWLRERLTAVGPGGPPLRAEVRLALGVHETREGRLVKDRTVGSLRAAW